MLLANVIVYLYIMGCTVGKEDLEAGKLDLNGSTLLPKPESRESSSTQDKEPEKSSYDSRSENINQLVEQIKQPKYKTKIDSRVTSKYEIKALIGKGSFSDVLRVDCKVTKQPFAIKILKVRNEQEEELLHAELSVLKSFTHRYIIHLEEVIISKECTYLIMELATGGELYDRIKSRGHLDETYSCNITQMILEGLSYLHDHGITHRDLKPENLLFYHPGKDSKILITDFGFSKIKTHSLDFSMTTWCGTPEYIAPELLKKVPYSSKVDIWALGAIVYVMLSGHLPFSADTTPKLFKQIMDRNYNFTREIWSAVSDSAKDFIDKLLIVDPMGRLDTTAASAHPWVKSQSPLHKRNAEAKSTQRRMNTRHRRHSKTEAESAKLKSKHADSEADEAASQISDSTWTNYMKNKASPLYKRQKKADENIVLPFTGGRFQSSAITKDKILEDHGSTMSPSNIDSVLATEDSNSQMSSQFGMLQMYYYSNMMSAQDPAEKKRTKEEYMNYMKVNELKLPVSAGGQENDSAGGNNRGGFIIPKIGSLKERKISVHDQFENIDEESEDGLTSQGLDLTKLDRKYANQGTNANSVVSGGSFKSAHMPIEISNASYIEKVGVWLNDSKDDETDGNGKFTFNHDKYKISTSDMDSLLSARRTISQKSNLTTSDHSQASSFNRVVLPDNAAFRRKKLSVEMNQSFHSNATSTTELLPPSIRSGASGRYFNKETVINIPHGLGGSFSSATSFQPLIIDSHSEA